jgi:hypothetical protein
MLAQCISISFGMTWEVCAIARQTAWQTRVEVLRTIIGFAAFVGGALISVAAAAFGRVVDSLAGLLFYRRRMGEMAGAEPGELANAFRQGAWLTFAAVTPSCALMLLEHGSAYTDARLVFAAVLAGAILWFALARRWRHPIITEIAAIASILRKTRISPTPDRL